MILVEITAAVDAAGTLKTFYLGDEGFVTRPTDTPADTHFDPALIDPGSLGVHAYSDSSTTGGAAGLEAGELVVNNVDGIYDDWLTYGFDGQPVVIRYREDGASAYPASFTTMFQGTIESISATWGTLILKLRDKQYLLELPALTNKYLGNNALPNGVEGTVADLKDRVKPKVFGKVLQVSPLVVNTSKLTYQVHDGLLSDIPAVYDRGVTLTKGANHATSALLNAATIAAGSYATCLAEGLLRLGASPAGTVTVDAVQGATAAARTTAQVLRALALAGGITAGEISDADVATLDAFSTAEVGIWIDSDSTTFRDAMDQVAASLSVWYGFDMNGVLRLGVLSEPAGTPVLELTEADVGKDIERRAARDTSVPVYSVVLKHTRLYTTQTDLAGAVPADRKAYLAQETRQVTAADETVKLKHKLATKLELETLLVDAAAATGEAARQLALYKINRAIYEVTLPLGRLDGMQLRFMDIVQLQLSRFSLASGKIFRLIGIRYQLESREIILSLWG